MSSILQEARASNFGKGDGDRRAAFRVTERGGAIEGMLELGEGGVSDGQKPTMLPLCHSKNAEMGSKRWMEVN